MANFKHGMKKSPEYQSWIHLKDRCLNPRNKDYENYGGRSISVCKAWQESFEAFYQDMGARPSESHSIERRNNDGDYTPENCYWADKTTQAINRRMRIDNKTGYIGITYYKFRYKSRITIYGKVIYIGSFVDIEDAVEARDAYIIENELSDYKLQSRLYNELYPE